jgi:hypothetical protein
MCPNMKKAFEEANAVKGGATLHVLVMGTYTGKPPVKQLYLDKSKRKISFVQQDRERDQAIDLSSSLKTTSANTVKFEVQLVKAKHTLDELTKRQMTLEQQQEAEGLSGDNAEDS